MIWSISGHKQFNKCRRQWYYYNVVADGRVKNDPFRREVTLLSRLQTISAWRGSIVDDIISRLLVNAINTKRAIQKDYFLQEAMRAYEGQLEYAMFQTYREPSRGKADKSFAALLSYEFGPQPTNEELSRAKHDINESLTNLLDNSPFIEYLQSAEKLVSQRTLLYQFDRFNVRAIPDLIAFFTDKPPHIFDWKVHTYGTNTYDEQLISYGIALYKVGQGKPHIDFPDNLRDFKVGDYRLTEYQLLHPERIKRDYEVTEDRIEDFTETVSRGLIEMYIAGCDKQHKNLSAEQFSTTLYVEQCQNCPFKRICKTDSDAI